MGTTITTRVPKEIAALRKELLTCEEYQDSLEELVKAGFRMSDEVYLAAVRMGRRRDWGW
ncbi:hypothetical protein ANME2D_00067 [Candidatus Methanoperedens nitroreducens]|uniref:Uncharacterized protein n=1 Tax=Candidatus Methanoperedens nitratireducens TaxID=1392998 RepID=A0A062V910_9EURY|nr:hypothetical protein [Candidatus Methanoperedens nitroreducens]KCZ73008.1 hypothetical protein ANME2D_00067 [Candidatus Methanoperedens nitroreducens]MDJ1423048.1 hypothetical protein [Candidatus Methanoperedens sp.]